VILADGHSTQVEFSNLECALAEPDTNLRLFGKPEVKGHRRMGVALARGQSIEEARRKANAASKAVAIKL
jgi:phosphoribosylglycinamide formyltransferase 2